MPIRVKNRGFGVFILRGNSIIEIGFKPSLLSNNNLALARNNKLNLLTGVTMRINSTSALIVAVLAVAVFAVNGCDSSGGSGTSNGGAASNADHDHDHDHDHGDHADHPAHGPFGGHIFALEPNDMQGEWKKYTDSNVIKMYLLDAAGKKEVPQKVDSFVVTPKVGNDEGGFTLEPENPDDMGVSAVYMLDDQELSIAIPLGVDIEIKIGDKVFKGEIKAHEPLDH